jgi:dTDP-glucose 4,6-dehydratase
MQLLVTGGAGFIDSNFIRYWLDRYPGAEKLLPRFTTHALDDRPVPLYRSSANRRERLYVTDHCRASDLILRRGRIGELYTIGGGVEQRVEPIADHILALIGEPACLKAYVPARPGHDQRSLLDSTMVRRALGWAPESGFADGMRVTGEWYARQQEWRRPWQQRLTLREGAWNQP